MASSGTPTKGPPSAHRALESGDLTATSPKVVLAATAINAEYLPFAAALVTTATRHCAEDTHLRLTIMHAGDLDKRNQERLAASGPGLSLEWLRVSDEHYAELGFERNGVIAQPHYFRCLLPHVLEPSIQRVVYLDADTMVFGDLTELYECDLAGAPVAAVQDWLPTVRDAVGPWQRLGLTGDAPYFNSGMLVMDLPRWREEEAGRRAMSRCLADKAHLAAKGKWLQHEQYGLNVVFHRRWLSLPSKWNRFSELAIDDAQVVHMVGNGKPWMPKCRPEVAEAFYAAVDSSAWRGWRRPRSAHA